MTKTDIAIVGGGIVGLATAYSLSRRLPHLQITVFEKEKSLAFHQSGRNSGVLHSGIYYKPGSLKATICRTGKKLMQEFCGQQDIPYQICGKVIVATKESERTTLRNIYKRGQANSVNCEIIDQSRLRDLEPHAAGVEAIHVPETGIVDYKKVCAHLAKILLEQGHQIINGAKVIGIQEGPRDVMVTSYAGDFKTQYLINCAGLYSDRLTSLGGVKSPAQIIPFRGEYYKLKPEAEHLCRSLIYPVPNPNFPFLGVHFTLTIDGTIECGPNAVLAFAREGYRLTDFNAVDLVEILRYPGFQKLAARYWRMGLGEMWRSANKKAFVRALQNLVPEIQTSHLERVPAGIRAQALFPNGKMVDDFTFRESSRIINVINAPSPAATSSLAVGNTIVDRLSGRFA